MRPRSHLEQLNDEELDLVGMVLDSLFFQVEDGRGEVQNFDLALVCRQLADHLGKGAALPAMGRAREKLRERLRNHALMCGRVLKLSQTDLGRAFEELGEWYDPRVNWAPGS
jgi:hypothetical protein